MLATTLLRGGGEGASTRLLSRSGSDELPISARHQMVRLRDVQSAFRQDSLSGVDFEVLLSHYSRWLNEPTFLLSKDKARGDIIYRYASKRGNYVYQERVRRRVEEATSWVSSSRGKSDRFLFITLTFNPDLFFGRISRAWESVSRYYNLFVSALREKYGRVWVLRSFESHTNGFPHIHMLVYFHDSRFHTLQVNGKTRVREYKDIKGLWRYGHGDVLGTPARGGVAVLQNYIMKDILKSYRSTFQHGDNKARLTLSLNWLFNKQSFAVSGSRLVPTKHNSNRIPDVDVYNPDDFEFLGVFVLHFFNSSDPPPVAGVISAVDVENVSGLERYK